MDTKKTAKITALIISIGVLCLTLMDNIDYTAVGIYAGCGTTSRLLYTFFHAGMVHAVINVWCLLSVVFIYDISIWRLLLSYSIAATIPIDTLTSLCNTVFIDLNVLIDTNDLFNATTPTVGLSGLVFVLFGSISFEVERKVYYQLWMIAYIIIGFLFPNTNAWLHLYCYLAGCIVALLNKPIIINKGQ